LTQKKPEAALFDTPRFARHLENIYQTVVERAASGQSPQNTDTFLPTV
jgi:predicted O-linked N-acetylglucosamine transferase (SPINDLY family)